MEDFTTIINEYVRSELLVLVPVLYILARYLDSSDLENRKLPFVLLTVSILLAGIYTFATVDISDFQKILMALFSSFVQGVLLSGTAVFGGILAQSFNKKKDS